MAKNTAQEIIDLGFTGTMFNKEDNDFDSFVDPVIAEQTDILLGRIGSSAYNSTTVPINKYVKRAEKCLAAAELVQRRINIILGNVVGAGREIDISHEGAQKKAYLDEANMWIAKIISGETSDSNDFASGVLVTSHFESMGLSGEEQT